METRELKTKKQIYSEQQAVKKTENNSQLPIETRAIKWSALEFAKHEKDPAWFIVGGLIAIALLTTAILTKNFLFGLIIILSSFSLFIWTQKQPKKINFSLTSSGLKIQDNIYAYDNLKSFWIFYEPPEIKYLSIESKKLFMPRIIIPIANENPNDIRKFLLKYLPEEKQHESLIDILARRLRY